MDWQEAAALSITAITVMIFGLHLSRRRRFRFNRDTHCGCSTGATGGAPRIVFSARKGGDTRVLVQMK
jgi:hypothetical protein